MSHDGTIHGEAAARAALRDQRPSMVWTTLVADSLTPVGAALALMMPGRGDWVLESVEGGETRGRYSMVGLDPDQMLVAADGGATLYTNWRHDRDAHVVLSEPPLDALRGLVAACRADVPAGLPPVLATLVGYLSFETVGEVEPVARAADPGLGLPDLLFVRAGLILLFDRLSDTVTLVAPVWPASLDGLDDQLVGARQRIVDAIARLGDSRPSLHPPIAASTAEPVEVSAVVSPDSYRDMVLRAKEWIAAGDIFQVVLAQRFSCAFPLPPIDLYRALRRVNPSPFLYFLDLPDFALIGSSPEILVRRRDDVVTIRPIAGTRPRGADQATDEALEAELRADPKENAEHLMLLDLGRNDVTRVSAPGSVRVTDSFMVERYSHVMHLVSNVEGRAHGALDAVSTLMGGFPAGTVSGAPKVRACDIIAALEPEARGPYGGGVGYFGPSGDMDSCIVLRTAVVKDGRMHVQAGAGVVADSDPEAEAAECRAKAGALFAAASVAIAADAARSLSAGARLAHAPVVVKPSGEGGRS